MLEDRAGHCCGQGRGKRCAGLMAGFLRPSLLLLIAELPGRYGYELASALEQLGLNVSVVGGRLYRALRQLEEEGLVASEWDTSGDGAAKRLYRLTAAGSSALASTAAEVELVMTMLETIQARITALNPECSGNPVCEEGSR